MIQNGKVFFILKRTSEADQLVGTVFERVQRTKGKIPRSLLRNRPQKRPGSRACPGVLIPFILSVIIVFSGSRCSLPLNSGMEDTLRILSYNVENIFDAVDDGSEYSSFDPGKGDWNEALYHSRLLNLAEVIKTSCKGGPDIVALQEIENERVVHDLVSFYLKGMGYEYTAVTGKVGSAVQVGVISRISFDSVRTHDIYSDGMVMTRPLLEVAVTTKSGTLYLFNNHWKSRIGGGRETEPVRILESSLIRGRLKELVKENPEVEVLVIGDLNENYDEYERYGCAYRTALLPLSRLSDYPGDESSLFISGSPEELKADSSAWLLYDPWVEKSNGEGSYFYRGAWETIDHALIGYGLMDGKGYSFLDFSVVRLPFILTRNGTPFGWSTSRGTGYSDHLPILVTIEY